MSGLQALVEGAYGRAKAGDWDGLLSEWAEFPMLARRCSRYRKEGAGWTFLHQAAYFGHEPACRVLIGLGADIGIVSSAGETAAQVAAERGYPALTALLQRALQAGDSLWAPSADPDLRPSSNRWAEATECRAVEPVLVGYAGGVVKIAKGARYYVDSLERVLVGWHGTFDPPCDMDGDPAVQDRAG